MHNKEICYGWLVFYKKFLINSWKFVLKKYSLNSHSLGWLVLCKKFQPATIGNDVHDMWQYDD